MRALSFLIRLYTLIILVISFIYLIVRHELGRVRRDARDRGKRRR